jgi:sugar lactone lactonase YvrE
MRLVPISSLLILPLLAGAAELTEVAKFPDRQLTGVAVSKSARVFVNFPTWSDDHSLSVAEIVDGLPKPYPNAEMNQPGPPESHFVCVQAVYVDARDALWIVDPAAPKMKEVIPGGAKLIKVDLATNQVVQTIPFGGSAAPKKSYLNDVRIDGDGGTAYLTDSGLGAIVVVDLKTGKTRRVLEGHKSTRSEKEVKLTVDGRELLDQEKKSPPQIQSDGIALDSRNGYLYYHALTGRTLYRVRTDYLKDEKISEHDLEGKVETVATTSPADGMLEAPDGSVYLTNLEKNGIDRWNASANKVETILSDKRLLWPDTMSWAPDGSIFVTASQIENMPRFNGGKSARTEPYRLFKLALPQAQSR